MAYPIDPGQGKALIAPFDGSGSIVDFMERFVILANAKRWDQQDKCSWLPVYLTGAAALHYKALLNAVKIDWGQLSRAMTQHFNDADARNLQITKLNKIRQTPNETVMQFSSRLRQMALTAYDGMVVAQVEPLILAHFLQGLKPEIKRHVILQAPATFDDACRIAKTVELNVGLYDPNRELNMSRRDNRPQYQNRQTEYYPQYRQDNTNGYRGSNIQGNDSW